MSQRRRGSVLSLLGPETLGPGFERLLVLLLVVLGVTQVYANLRPRVPEGIPARDSMQEFLESSRGASWAGPFLIVLLLAGTAAAVFLHGGFFLEKLRAKEKDEPLDDPLREPPPWGLVHVGIALFGAQVILGLAGLALSPPALVERSSGERILLGAKPTTVGAAKDRFELEYWPQHGFVARGAEGTEAQVAVNGSRVPPGSARLLERGDELRAGPVVYVLETPSLARKMLVSAFGSLVVIAFVLALVHAMGGSARDVGLTPDGLLRETGRGALHYLACVPLFFAAVLLSYTLCRALSVPYEEHPILRELVKEPSLATLASVVFYVVLLGPFTEELIYRGLLLRALRRPVTGRVATVVV
ncbi:CPBP family intramembrane metalloprotease, partial [bacterium]|nr:CPBP family intramembrane metalloprotease [bacterium]